MEQEDQDTSMERDAVLSNDTPASSAEELEPPTHLHRIEIGLIRGDIAIMGGAPQVFLRVHGKPSDESENIGEYSDDMLRFSTLPGKSELHVPHDVEILVRRVDGNLHGGQLTGRLSIDRVAGNVLLDHMGVVELHWVGGNAHISYASGPVSVGHAGGNVHVKDAPAGVLAEAGGNTTVDTSLGAQTKYVLYAASTVVLRTHGEINARFVAQTARGEIHTQLPLTVERGRRRNLVGVIGRGDATVALHSKYSNIHILAADGGEREDNMSEEFARQTSDKERGQGEGSRVWEGAFGGRHFRAQWERGPKSGRFSFQGPFSQDDDPDGMGRAFEPDFGFEWERGHGAHTYGHYGERFDDMRERAERAARRATERARHYAERTARRMRDINWDELEHEVRATVEKAMTNLEHTFSDLRSEWTQRQQTKDKPASTKKDERSKGQRVRVEYDDESEPLSDDPMDEPGASGTASGAKSTLSPNERAAQRRTILEELRTGAVSLEEAERRLNALN